MSFPIYIFLFLVVAFSFLPRDVLLAFVVKLVWLRRQPALVHEPTQAGAPPSARRGKSQHMGKEAAMAAHSTIVLHFYGSQGFFCKHSCLQSSSLPSLQAVSSQPTAVLSPSVCSPNTMFQLPAPFCTGGHTSQAWVCRAVAWTICVGLTLSCLPQTWLLCSPLSP